MSVFIETFAFKTLDDKIQSRSNDETVWVRLIIPNLCSFPFAGLVSSGQFFEAIQFVIKYPECFGNIILLSLVSLGETLLPFPFDHTFEKSRLLVLGSSSRFVQRVLKTSPFLRTRSFSS
jgi:hypothetical protein